MSCLWHFSQVSTFHFYNVDLIIPLFMDNYLTKELFLNKYGGDGKVNEGSKTWSRDDCKIWSTKERPLIPPPVVT